MSHTVRIPWRTRVQAGAGGCGQVRAGAVCLEARRGGVHVGTVVGGGVESAAVDARLEDVVDGQQLRTPPIVVGHVGAYLLPGRRCLDFQRDGDACRRLAARCRRCQNRTACVRATLRGAAPGARVENVRSDGGSRHGRRRRALQQVRGELLHPVHAPKKMRARGTRSRTRIVVRSTKKQTGGRK